MIRVTRRAKSSVPATPVNTYIALHEGFILGAFRAEGAEIRASEGQARYAVASHLVKLKGTEDAVKTAAPVEPEAEPVEAEPAATTTEPTTPAVEAADGSK